MLPHPGRREAPFENKHHFSLLFSLLDARTSLEGLKAKALKRKEKEDISPPRVGTMEKHCSSWSSVLEHPLLPQLVALFFLLPSR